MRTSRNGGTELRQSLPHTPSDLDDEVLTVDALLFEVLDVPVLQDPETLSKSRLRNESERVTLGQHDDKIVNKKSRGHGLLQTLDEMNTTLKILTAKDGTMSSQIKEHERQIEEHRKQIMSLKGHVGRLMQTKGG
ncbi:hypothetical protein MMC12_000565 [Toensbergia leucococca]|nr:hypothetical protein [Toensbergia leucococca]